MLPARLFARGTRKNADIWIQEKKSLIKTEYRHAYHLMADTGWINDPNGFSYFKGQYHLFYQYNPYNSIWGTMHWGHSVSDDLIHWRTCPVALAPDEVYDQSGCFSGTALVVGDKHILMYTGVTKIIDAGRIVIVQEQCIASGQGEAYFKYPANPVIRSEMIPEGIAAEDVRDPKLFVQDGIYYCIAGTKTVEQKGAVILFRSTDLLTWRFTGILDQSDEISHGVWECPDYFNLDGQDILFISPQFKAPEEHQYHNLHSACCRFGKLDLAQGEFLTERMTEVDGGFDFYAPQTIIDPYGRRVMIAWMQMWERMMPTNSDQHGWAGAMTFPRELSIRDGQLRQWPVTEIERYRGSEYAFDALFSGIYKDPLLRGVTVDLTIDVENISAKSFGVRLFKGNGEETVFDYQAASETLTFDRRRNGRLLTGNPSERSGSGIRTAELALLDGKLSMRFLLDRTSVEGFFNDGLLAMTGNVYPSSDSETIEIYSDGLVHVKVVCYQLQI